MDPYFQSSIVSDNTPDLVQQTHFDHEQEGDLTDEYIINMMHDVQITHQGQGHFDYHPFKLFDPIQDVLDMSITTRKEALEWHGAQDNDNVIPTISKSESSDHLLCLDSSYSHNKSDDKSPVNSYQESEDSNTINIIPTTVNLLTNNIVTSPQLSPYYGQLVENSPIPNLGNPYDEESMKSHKLVVPTTSIAVQQTWSSPHASPYDAHLSQSPIMYYPEKDGAFNDDTFEDYSPLPESQIANTKRTANNDQQEPPKKRGRKPRSEAEKAEALAKQQAKIKRIRRYEIDQPFEDKELERKRVNAINAKKHRDHQKDVMKRMEQDLADVIIERDILQQKNEELASQLDQVSKKLEAFQKFFGIESVPF